MLGLTACASISLKYESDVRFERCYALDWKQDVDAGIRGRCWEEWLTHYAEGQTQDRIQYARRQTGGAGGAGITALAAAPATASAMPVALPEPTSVFSPVPMMVKSASGSAIASASADVSALPRSSCETRCDKTLESCLTGCNSSVCEHYCAQKHGKCAAKCEPVKAQ